VTRFSYYRRLSARQRAVYRRSDEVVSIALPDAASLQPLVAEIDAGLLADDRKRTQKATVALAQGICAALEVPPVVLRVLARRPSNAREELHGLYEREEGKPAVIRVWMRTAAFERPVALRTFVRTVLHELCHHFDFERLALPDSYHTEGFFRRESSLARQLLPRRERRGQLDLFGSE
jgi:hypothetical protein